MRYLANGSIRVPETPADLTELWEWLDRQHTLAVDTETTGLDIYSDGHRLRLIALATPTEAWVYPFETFGRKVEIEEALVRKRTIMHNASYDIQVMSKHCCLPIDSMWRGVRDTRILAHQVDPRGREEGGIGQRLEELVAHYMPEYSKLGDDLKDEFLRLKKSGGIPKRTSMSEMWATLPIDNEVYLLYAGTDAILTARLFKILSGLIDPNSELTKNDHTDAMIACLMDAQGVALDVEYTTDLRERLLDQEVHWKQVAASFGLENINSSDQVAEILVSVGLARLPKEVGTLQDTKGKRPVLGDDGVVTLGLTSKGNPTVTKIELGMMPDHKLVEAIVKGKKAGKERSTWIEKFLGMRDSAGRVHPSTNTLRARTARYSITGIPAQTLPSKDSVVRSCFAANIGEVIAKFDYKQQEPRFAAAMCPDPRMIRGFKNGEDLYVVLADAAWRGQGLDMRWAGKGGLLTTMYGGGIPAMVDQWKMTPAQASLVQNTIGKTFPGIRRKTDLLMVEAEKYGYIKTWTGRKLPVDQHRLYSAFNYYVQSGSRDITAAAVRRLYAAGFLQHMLLIIHDEILMSAPNDPEFVREVERIMSTTVRGLEIPAEGKLGSRSWGSLYE